MTITSNVLSLHAFLSLSFCLSLHPSTRSSPSPSVCIITISSTTTTTTTTTTTKTTTLLSVDYNLTFMYSDVMDITRVSLITGVFHARFVELHVYMFEK